MVDGGCGGGGFWGWWWWVEGVVVVLEGTILSNVRFILPLFVPDFNHPSKVS